MGYLRFTDRGHLARFIGTCRQDACGPGFRSLLLAATLFLSLASLSFAQSPSDDSASRLNEKFYPHDYAKSPLDGKANQVPGSNLKDSNNAAKGQTTEPLKNEISTSIVPGNEPSGKPIESISLIASGLDFASLKHSAEVLLRLFNSKSIRGSTIYLIGQSSETTPDDLNQLLRRLNLAGVKFTVRQDPPPNFKVEKVPSWIITTKDGDIVLEGLNSPEKLINSKSEFVDPHDLSEAEEVP